ncbi:MAG: lipopolysaccharide biosynthesis protein [Planctomycetota bacterium]
MAESMTVYVPAMVLQKGIGLARLLLMVHLLSRAEYGLWAVGAFLFDVLAPVITLGSNHGLTRYVSFYEARGEVRRFYRRIRLPILGVCVALAAVALVNSDLLARYVVASRVDAEGIETARHTRICLAALGNALVIALYLNLLGFCYGLRTYRLIALLEIMFNVTFTAAAVVVIVVSPTATAVLLAHSAAVALSLLTGLVLLNAGLNRPAMAKTSVAATQPVFHGAAEADENAPLDALPTFSTKPDATVATDRLGGTLLRILRYGFVALVSNVLWNLLGYVSYYLTHRHYGEETGGTFQAYMRLLGQPVMALSGAAWAVVFTHVVRHWEQHRQDDGSQPAQPLQTLQTAYKGVVMCLMTVGVLLYATAGLWVHVMPGDTTAEGRTLVPGLLMFFQSLAHLALLTMLAKLRERPAVIALAAVVGAVANVGLALWWMPSAGPAGAATAAGVGMYLGGGAVAVGYFLLARLPIRAGTYLVLAAPVLYLLPAWLTTTVWGGMVVVAFCSPLLFDRREKDRLRSAAGRLLRRFGRNGNA